MDLYTEICKVAGTVHVSLILDCFGNWCASGWASSFSRALPLLGIFGFGHL